MNSERTGQPPKPPGRQEEFASSLVIAVFPLFSWRLGVSAARTSSTTQRGDCHLRPGLPGGDRLHVWGPPTHRPHAASPGPRRGAEAAGRVAGGVRRRAGCRQVDRRSRLCGRDVGTFGERSQRSVPGECDHLRQDPREGSRPASRSRSGRVPPRSNTEGPLE